MSKETRDNGDNVGGNRNQDKLPSNFWNKVENELGSSLGIHFKNILRFNNLDNP